MPVPQIDFSPLGDLYNTYRQGQAGAALQNFGEQLTSGNPDYRALAGLAAQAGRPDLAISLLQQSDNKAAGLALASMFGGQQQPQSVGATPAPSPASVAPTPGAVPVSPAAPPSPTQRAEVTPTPQVWGDREAEAAGLYDPTPGGPAPGVPVPQPRPAGAPQATPVAAAQPAPQAAPTQQPATPPQGGMSFTVLNSPAAQGMPDTVRKALPVLLGSPQYASVGMQLLQRYINPEQFSLVRDNIGNIYSVNNQTHETKPVVQATPAMANAAASGMRTPLQYEAATQMTGAAAKNTELTPEQKNALTPPGTASGVNPVVDYEAAAARAKKVADAQGDTIGEVVKAARPAAQRIQQLAVIGDALNRGGGSITTGPFAEAVLRGRQAIGDLFGVDLKGVPEAEVAQKTGLGLAIQTVKELTSRGTQFELRSAVANNPGLLLSPTGSKAMINILTQTARQDIDLARLAQNPANHANWQDVQDNYYKTHPLMSPFDPNQPLGVNDLKRLQAAAPAAQQSDLASRATATATNPQTGKKAYYVDGKWIQ